MTETVTATPDVSARDIERDARFATLTVCQVASAYRFFKYVAREAITGDGWTLSSAREAAIEVRRALRDATFNAAKGPDGGWMLAEIEIATLQVTGSLMLDDQFWAQAETAGSLDELKAYLRNPVDRADVAPLYQVLSPEHLAAIERCAFS